MRVLSLLSVISLALSCAADPADAFSGETSISKLNTNTESRTRAQRSLRQNDEDRDFENAVNKVDDVVASLVHKPLRLPRAVSVAELEKVDDIATSAKEAMKKYPKELSSSTITQLEKVEERRVVDILKLKENPDDAMSKLTTTGMRREVEYSPGMKVAPVLTSHVGRADQRFAEDGSRLMTCAVVSRSAKEGGGDVLLISSSNAEKKDWLLPKGGWNKGESLHKAAWREVIEEGGVNGAFTAALGELKFKNKDGKSYIYHAYKMKGVTTYDQWAESKRYRIWVSFDDAEKLLVKRPEMVDIVRRAREAA